MKWEEGGEQSHREASPCLPPAAFLGMAAQGNPFVPLGITKVDQLFQKQR